MTLPCSCAFMLHIQFGSLFFLGEAPQPRLGYQLPEPNGCSSSLVGLQVNGAVGGLFVAPTSARTTWWI